MATETKVVTCPKLLSDGKPADSGIVPQITMASQSIGSSGVRSPPILTQDVGKALTSRTPNPKKVVSDLRKSYEKIVSGIETALAVSEYDMMAHTDIGNVGSIPSLMMQETVRQMDEVLDAAEKIVEEECSQMIAAFLMGLLMFILALGSAAGAAGLASLGSLLTIAGMAADIGVTVYDIVDNPDSALMTVFCFLFGGGASRQRF
ncbi:hypothetical protein ACHAQH_009857 [Verticillium albo-atrum]